MADKYWRHKPSGSVYGFNPHVDFDKNSDYEQLTDDEVTALQGGNLEPKPEVEPEPKPFPVAEDKWDDEPEVEAEATGELDDLDDILG